MPRFRTLVDGTLRGWGLAVGPGVGRQLFPPESLFTREDLITQLGGAGFRVDEAWGRAIVFIKAFRP